MQPSAHAKREGKWFIVCRLFVEHTALSHLNITVPSNWIRAWVEALQIYEDIRSAQYTKTENAVKPNFITVNAIITALERANQSEIAESIYKEAVRDKIVSPWKRRHDIDGKLRMMLVSVNQSFLFFLFILCVFTLRLPYVAVGSSSVLCTNGKNCCQQLYGTYSLF